MKGYLLLTIEKNNIEELSQEFKQKLEDITQGYDISNTWFKRESILLGEYPLFLCPQGKVEVKTQRAGNNTCLQFLKGKRDYFHLECKVSDLLVPEHSPYFFFTIQVKCIQKDNDIEFEFNRPYSVKRVGSKIQQVWEVPLYFLDFWDKSLRNQLVEIFMSCIAEVSDEEHKVFQKLEKEAFQDVLHNASQALESLNRIK